MNKSEIFLWEHRTSRSTIGSEFVLIFDGANSGYTITYDHAFGFCVVTYKEDVVLELDDLSDAKKWCEREFKLKILEANNSSNI